MLFPVVEGHLQESRENSRLLLGGQRSRPEGYLKDVPALQMTPDGCFRLISTLLADFQCSGKVDEFVRAGLPEIDELCPADFSP